MSSRPVPVKAPAIVRKQMAAELSWMPADVEGNAPNSTFSGLFPAKLLCLPE